MKKRNFYILLFFLLSLFSCNNDKLEKLEREKKEISLELQSVKQELDSIKKSNPILFEEALKLENKNLKKSIEIYTKIIKSDSLSLWNSLSEKRILRIQELNDTTKKYIKNLFCLSDTLLLTHRNEKCGEWGGDYEEIKITLHTKGVSDGDLYAQYTKYTMNCDSIEEPMKISIRTKKKKLLINEERLVKECIEDLLKHKLNNPNWICHSGIFNSVILKDRIAFVQDPAIVISDYPSFYWTNFHKLTKIILNK